MRATSIRNLKSCCLLAASLVVALAPNARAQGEPRYAELPNFHKINSQLYRGAQPKPGGLPRLKAMGVKTIVNLRGEDDHSEAEGEEVRRLGLVYYNISLAEFSGPKDEEVQRAIDIISAPENQPVFVHCRRGQDRTGTIIACYRIIHDGWSAADAKKEAESRGMSWTQIGMKRYIDGFYKRQHRAAVERNGDAKSVQPESLVRML